MDMLNDDIVEILNKNNRKEKYKDDPKIKKAVLRAIYELIRIEYVAILDGKLFKQDIGELESLSNFELMDLLEIVLLTKKILPVGMANVIESIDYLGKCWYTPKELAVELLKQTEIRHNFRKLKRILDIMEKEGKILKLIEIKKPHKYRCHYNLKTKLQKMENLL